MKNEKIEDHQVFRSNIIRRYPNLRKLVIEELGDGLRNLSEKRKEKLIQRCVILYIKASTDTVHKALDILHHRIEQKEKGAAEDKNVEVRK